MEARTRAAGRSGRVIAPELDTQLGIDVKVGAREVSYPHALRVLVDSRGGQVTDRYVVADPLAPPQAELPADAACPTTKQRITMSKLLRQSRNQAESTAGMYR